jgi:hypothetical protein
VAVEAPKEPIKVDISMRLDIYQHVQKDIDSIEDYIMGSSPAPVSAAKDKQSFLGVFLTNAYAEDGLSPEVQQAATMRKGRLSTLASWESKGVIGENKMGLVEIRNQGAADNSARELVNAENSNRMSIYRAVAEKNGTSVASVQELYAKRLQNDAPAGTPIEVVDASGSSSWVTK